MAHGPCPMVDLSDSDDDDDDDDSFPEPVFKKSRQETRAERKRDTILQDALQHVEYRRALQTWTSTAPETDAAWLGKVEQIRQRTEEKIQERNAHKHNKESDRAKGTVDDWEYNHDHVWATQDRQARLDAILLEACQPIGTENDGMCVKVANKCPDSKQLLAFLTQRLPLPRRLWAHYLQYQGNNIIPKILPQLLEFSLTQDAPYDLFQILTKQQDALTPLLTEYVDAWVLVDSTGRVLGSHHTPDTERKDCAINKNICMQRLLRLLAHCQTAIFSTEFHALCLATLATDPKLRPLVGEIVGTMSVTSPSLPVVKAAFSSYPLGLLVALAPFPESNYALECARAQLEGTNDPSTTWQLVREALQKQDKEWSPAVILQQIRCALECLWREKGDHEDVWQEWNHRLGPKLTKYCGHQPLLTRAHAEAQAGMSLIHASALKQAPQQPVQATLQRYFGTAATCGELDSP